MDQQKLRTLVFEKTGVKIDVDDPVFALVALNEAVLEEAVGRHVALLNEASGALAGQVSALRGGAAAAMPVPSDPLTRTVLVAAAASVLGAVLVLAGQALFLRSAPAAAPAPLAQVRDLASGQAALRNGERLARIVEKLDPKTRRMIEAEMQKQ
jgi:hypothetical protein